MNLNEEIIKILLFLGIFVLPITIAIICGMAAARKVSKQVEKGEYKWFFP